MTKLILRDVEIHKGFLDRAAQGELLDAVRGVVAAAPLFQPDTPYGKPMSVRMSSAGRYGWFSDRSGYRYADRHPSGTAWPPVPDAILAIWDRVTGLERQPDCCLINYYGEGARMGLHQDRDEADFAWPVVSVSLGDPGLFRAGRSRGRPDQVRRRHVAAQGRADQLDAARGGLRGERTAAGQIARAVISGQHQSDGQAVGAVRHAVGTGAGIYRGDHLAAGALAQNGKAVGGVR